MDYAVSYSTDLGEILDHAVGRVRESRKNVLDGYLMVRKRILKNNLLAAGGRMLQTSVDADTLAETYRKSLLGLGINQLILQRTAAAVNDQYFHVFPPLLSHLPAPERP